MTHVDFLRINRDEEIEVEVPIHLEGEATDVQRNDGLVDLALDTSRSSRSPATSRRRSRSTSPRWSIGDVIRVHDIALPAGVTTPLDPETPLVTAEATRATIEEEERPRAKRAKAQAGPKVPRRSARRPRQRRRLTHPVPPRRLRTARERPTCWSWVSATPARSTRAAGTTSVLKSSRCSRSAAAPR